MTILGLFPNKIIGSKYLHCLSIIFVVIGHFFIWLLLGPSMQKLTILVWRRIQNNKFHSQYPLLWQNPWFL
jgi:hypothetical protein